MNIDIKKFGKKKKKVDKSEPDKGGGNDLIPSVEEMNKRIDDLSELLESNLNYWTTFKVSIIRGFGTVVGMTIMIAAVIYGIDKFLTNVDDIPILTPILIYIQTWLEST